MNKHDSVNVLGEPLEACGEDPVTGFFRDGCCNTADEDFGSHTVCVELTAEFLEFSKRMGNDLITPRPEFEFPGLVPGDRWCLCASRWLQAHQADSAPKVFIRCCHQRCLEIIDLELLKRHALDLQ